MNEEKYKELIEAISQLYKFGDDVIDIYIDCASDGAKASVLLRDKDTVQRDFDRYEVEDSKDSIFIRHIAKRDGVNFISLIYKEEKDVDECKEEC